ncbi:thermonuclease family protein [Pseudomonas sp. Z5-35]|uniref:thermonuclease family protein n=1 Tax=unclassified Pseudomonas TaxID=196821 RepID=UPI003DA85C7A
MKKASLAGAFFVAAIWLSGAQASCPLQASVPEAQVQRVVDGDTLYLEDGRRIRMIGLNSPELGKRGRADEPFAVAAHQRLEALVAASAGRVRVLPGKDDRDDYGRTLAHVYDSQGRNLEEQLIAEGLGFLVAVAPNVDLVGCQQAAERQARQAGLGLWKQSPVVRAERISAPGFVLTSGRVASVQRNRGGIWIQLQGSVVLHIAPHAQRNFDASILKGLEGRKIEARGWVVDRSRRGAAKPGQAQWMLPLTDPAMLQALR